MSARDTIPDVGDDSVGSGDCYVRIYRKLGLRENS
jgi:hypothetical protein